MNYLGIDYGLNKIGLALADDEVKIAMPHEVIFEDDREKQLAEILHVIKGEGINVVVIGVPTNRAGKESAQTTKAREFISKLKAQLPSQVTLHEEDERFSTKMSQKLMETMGKKAQTAPDDAIAAACILQGYLDKV